MFFFCTVITITSQAEERCFTLREGECFLGRCRQWCFQNYNGNECCQAYGDPVSPKYKCICVHKC